MHPLAVRAVRYARAAPLVVVADIHAVVDARDEEVGRARQGLEPPEDNAVEEADYRSDGRREDDEDGEEQATISAPKDDLLGRVSQ